ncbi:thioesterase family protein [Ferrimonas pelagia]|uniref:Thioesterase n=1 Tax=Ferrimonas pelagia TaxID=1177826 RepID=A0ABP9ENV3_9GAMM
MSTRVQIDFPDTPLFTTEFLIGSNQVNRGDHVGNNHFVELCGEIALRYFHQRGLQGFDVLGQQLINGELSLKLLGEGRCFDTLNGEFAVANFHRYGCDFLYRIRRGEQVIALGRFAMLTFDYQQGKLVEASDGFAAFFVEAESLN